MATHAAGMSPKECPCEVCTWLVQKHQQQTTLLTGIGQQLSAVIVLLLEKQIITEDELGVAMTQANEMIEQAKAEMLFQLYSARAPTGVGS